MTTFMGNDPNTGADETSPEGIQRPEGELGGPIKNRVWELDDFRMNTGIKEGGDLVDSSQGDEICDAGGVYALDFTCQRTKEGLTRKVKIATRSA